MRMSGGSEAFSSSKAAVTRSVNCRVSVPGCLLTVRITQGPPANVAVLLPDERGTVAPLDFRPFDHLGHLRQEHRASAANLHHQFAQVFDRLDSAQRADQELVGALAVQVAAGDVAVALLEGRFDLVQVDAVGEHRVGVDEHLKLLASPTHRKDLRDAGNGQEPLPNHPIGQACGFPSGWSCCLRSTCRRS